MDEYKRRRRRSRAVMSMFLDSLGGSIDNVDVATFDSDGTDLKALVVGIEPIQDLHGYDNPWPDGGGANKWNEETELGTISTIDGQDIASTTQIRTKDYVPVVGGNRYCVVTRAGAGNGVWTLFYDSDKNVITSDLPVGAAQANNAVRFDNQGSINVPVGCAYIRWYFQLSYGATYLNDTALNYPSSVTTYTPYSNICPITGHSSVNVIVSPTLNPLDGTITNIPLGTTVYGGQLDVLTGVLTVTHANISSYNGESINEPWISSMDAYSSGETPTTGAQVVYPLTTPTTIQLTGQQIATFLGTNNVWCDSGKIIHLEY